jgi:hypothetical protein
MGFFFTGHTNNVDKALRMAKALKYTVKGTTRSHDIDCTQEQAGDIAETCDVQVGKNREVVRFTQATYKIMGKKAAITLFEAHLRSLKTMKFRDFRKAGEDSFITVTNAEQWEVVKSVAEDFSVRLVEAW